MTPQWKNGKHLVNVYNIGIFCACAVWWQCTFFSDQTLYYWFVMKDRWPRSIDPWGHKWNFERHFSWQVVHFQLSNWQGHRWAGLLMISQINQSKPIELRNQELLICYFVFFSLLRPTHSSTSVLTRAKFTCLFNRSVMYGLTDYNSSVNFGTLKHHQKWQKFGKKWRKTLSRN